MRKYIGLILILWTSPLVIPIATSASDLPNDLHVAEDLFHLSPSPGKETITQLAGNITNSGSTISYIPDTEPYAIPQDTNVLLIPRADAEWSPSEIGELLSWYHSEGPKLLWIAGDSDFGGFYNFSNSHYVLNSLGSSLRFASQQIDDPVSNDGQSYRLVATNFPTYGTINSVTSSGIGSILMHGTAAIVAEKNGTLIDPSQQTVDGIEVLAMSSTDATATDMDASQSVYDYYAENSGPYPLVAIEDMGDQRWILVSGETIFSDQNSMYSLTTQFGQNQDGKSFVDNIFNWFSDFGGIHDIRDTPAPNQVTDLTLLYINDLHGWLKPHDHWGGVSTMMGYFESHGYNPGNESFMLLSGGDQNTGPAIATLSQGDAVIDVMNEMGFTAASIGNHEFDYGLDVLHKQAADANFPILSANIYDVGTKDLANFTIPWVIEERQGIKVGFIGLTTTSTYTSAHPKYTQYFDFGNYEEALRDNIDDVRSAGAEIIIALTHITPQELRQLATDVSDLDIALFLGGHGGGALLEYVGDSLVIAAEHQGRQYAKIDLTFHKEMQELLHLGANLHDNLEGGVVPNAGIQAVVDYWDGIVDADEVISYTSKDLTDNADFSEIGALVTDAFLHHFYNRNDPISFGIANRGGGFRDIFRTGDITVADIVSVAPFENNLVLFEVSGQDLIDIYQNNQGRFVFSGLNEIDGSMHVIVDEVWTPIDSNIIYTGVVDDYNWYLNFKDRYVGTDTGIHYRDIIIEYFRTLDDLADHTTQRYFSTDSQLMNSSQTQTETDGTTSLATLDYSNVVYFIPTFLIAITISRKKLTQCKALFHKGP